MAYTDDAVKSKLSSLNETQEGIVAVAQWVLFHRRHADKTAQLWMQKLKDSSPGKRLNLVYLANEVVQQSKARKKNEFVNAFNPIIADSTALAYKGSPNDTQQKIRRVIEVWRARQIFEPSVQDDIEKRVDELDKVRGTKKPALGGSLFASSGGPSAPPELQSLIPLQTDVTKATVTAEPVINNATAEFDKLTDPNATVPTPPVHAARLQGLMNALAKAEGAVAEGIKAREALIAELVKIMGSETKALAADRMARDKFASKRATIEAKSREVENLIMRGMAAGDAGHMNGAPSSSDDDVQRPDVESFTPPPMEPESLTPPGEPEDPSMSYPDGSANTTGADFLEEQPPNHLSPPPQDSALPGLIPLDSRVRNHESEEPSMNGIPNGSAKRRRVGSGAAHDDDMAHFAAGGAMDEIDADVAAMLEKEG